MTKSSRSGVKITRIVIGHVGAPHGVAGEVRIQPLTDFEERFDRLEEIQVGEELLHITRSRRGGRGILMKFQECATREDAMRLTGKLLTIDRADAIPLAEGEYYTFDIIGLAVFTQEGDLLGTVENVLRTGSNDVYAVRREDGKETLIPALKSVVKRISIQEGRMEVVLAEEISDAD